MLVIDSCFLLHLLHSFSSAQVDMSLYRETALNSLTRFEAPTWSTFAGSLHWQTEGLRKAVCRAIRERERPPKIQAWFRRVLALADRRPPQSRVQSHS